MTDWPTLSKAGIELARIVVRKYRPGERNPLVRELTELMLCLARGRLGAREFTDAWNQVVRGKLISWHQESTLKQYLPRLLYYCLGHDGEPPIFVNSTFHFMVGELSLEEFLKQLRLEFLILDKLNSVPWSYGIRAWKAGVPHCFVPILEARTVFDPEMEARRTFRTTCERQEYARIELFTGPEQQDDVSGCTPLLWRRVPLPPGLPQGQKVEIILHRAGEEGLRLELRSAEGERTAIPWWRLEDSAGFSELAAKVAKEASSSQAEPPAKILKILLGYFDGCCRILTLFPDQLSGEVRCRLAQWLQQTSGALEQRDEEGLRDALQLIVEDFYLARQESVVVVLETLLAATGAPAEVSAEFKRLAEELLVSKKRSREPVERAWTMVEEWHRLWNDSRQQARQAGGSEDDEVVEELLPLLRSMLKVMHLVIEGRLEVEQDLAPLVDAVRMALKHFAASSDLSTTSTLSELHYFIEQEEWPDRITIANDLQPILSKAFLTTAKALARITPAPLRMEEELTGLIWSSTARAPAEERHKILMDKMVNVVSGWYEMWKAGVEKREAMEFQQAEALLDIVAVLEDPVIDERALVSILEKEPLDSGLFLRLRRSVRASQLFAGAPRQVRERVLGHLRLIDRLANKWHQEAIYHASVFRELAEASRLDELPEEVQEPLGDWEHWEIEDLRGTGMAWGRGGWGGGEAAAFDDRELLEAIPDEEGGGVLQAMSTASRTTV